jgi:glyoxylate/succinic semialdehyde reductase
VFNIQDLGAIANPMFKMKGATMLKDKFDPAFPLKHQQKDMRLALALGDDVGVSMPIAAVSNEVTYYYNMFAILLFENSIHTMHLET